MISILFHQSERRLLETSRFKITHIHSEHRQIVGFKITHTHIHIGDRKGDSYPFLELPIFFDCSPFLFLIHSTEWNTTHSFSGQTQAHIKKYLVFEMGKKRKRKRERKEMGNIKTRISEQNWMINISMKLTSPAQVLANERANEQNRCFSVGTLWWLHIAILAKRIEESNPLENITTSLHKKKQFYVCNGK